MRLRTELEAIAGDGSVATGDALAPFLTDATEAQGLRGRAEAYVAPASVEQVQAVAELCSRRSLALTPRGGGSGYAGGCVPEGGVVLGTERLRAVRSLDPPLWRAEVEAGIKTRDVQRLARENGLLYPPDPGAPEQSHIGGNVATNAGGPHAFKYGVTGAWVTGIEAVLASGEVVRSGGAVRKDVAGYDLTALLTGSEGTLAIITSVWLRMIPAVEARRPVVAYFADAGAGCEGMLAAMSSGITPAAIEYLDGAILAVAGSGRRGFCLVAEADGTAAEAERGREALIDALAPIAEEIEAPSDAAGADALWRWREGIGLQADAYLGGKMSEDIAVPIDRLAEAIEGTAEIAARHGLEGGSWGHAGDGNLHSTFMFDRSDTTAVATAASAADELFALAIALGGTISGEHGLGVVKRGRLREQWDPAAVRLHAGIKALFDPAGVLNPGKKLA